MYAHSFININTSIPAKTAFSLGVAPLFSEVLKQSYCLIGLILPRCGEGLIRACNTVLQKGWLQQEDLCLIHLYLYEWEMFSFVKNLKNVAL